MLDPLVGRIFELCADRQSPKPLHIPSHLIEWVGRKGSFEVFLHHLPNFGAAQFHGHNLRIHWNDVPEIVHREQAGRDWSAVAPSIRESDFGAGCLGYGRKEEIIHQCGQHGVAVKADVRLADNFVELGAVRCECLFNQ